MEDENPQGSFAAQTFFPQEISYLDSCSDPLQDPVRINKLAQDLGKDGVAMIIRFFGPHGHYWPSFIAARKENEQERLPSTLTLYSRAEYRH